MEGFDVAAALAFLCQSPREEASSTDCLQPDQKSQAAYRTGLRPYCSVGGESAASLVVSWETR